MSTATFEKQRRNVNRLNDILDQVEKLDKEFKKLSGSSLFTPGSNGQAQPATSGKSDKKRRGRPPGSKNATATATSGESKKDNKKKSMDDYIIDAINNYDGIDHPSLVEEVIKLGYKPRKSKDISRAVYTRCSVMKKAGRIRKGPDKLWVLGKTEAATAATAAAA